MFKKAYSFAEIFTGNMKNSNRFSLAEGSRLNEVSRESIPPIWSIYFDTWTESPIQIFAWLIWYKVSAFQVEMINATYDYSCTNCHCTLKINGFHLELNYVWIVCMYTAHPLNSANRQTIINQISSTVYLKNKYMSKHSMLFTGKKWSKENDHRH